MRYLHVGAVRHVRGEEREREHLPRLGGTVGVVVATVNGEKQNIQREKKQSRNSMAGVKRLWPKQKSMKAVNEYDYRRKQQEPR